MSGTHEQRKSWIHRLVVPGLLAALLVCVSYLPTQVGMTPSGLGIDDRLAHAGAFGFLSWAFMACLGWRRGFWGALGIFVVVCSIGGLIEWMQPSFGRKGEAHDFWANMVGAGMVVWGMFGYVRVREWVNPQWCADRRRGRGVKERKRAISAALDDMMRQVTAAEQAIEVQKIQISEIDDLIDRLNELERASREAEAKGMGMGEFEEEMAGAARGESDAARKD